LLEDARGRVKTAIVMHFRQTDCDAAERLLKEHDGKVRAAREATAAQ
jgi:N-acetylmuramic acid 6-phosphate (MurNAc-6-P) etherase